MSSRRRTQHIIGKMSSPNRHIEAFRDETNIHVYSEGMSSDIDGNNNISNQSQEIHEEGSYRSQSGERRTRGPNWLHGEWGNDGGPLKIELNKYGQPIAKSALRLASHLGVIARNGIMTPLIYTDWRIMPAHFKDNMWNHIKENTTAIDDMRVQLMQFVARKWKDWKSVVKSVGYDAYNTTEECLANCPNRVEQCQWEKLVSYWDGEKAKEKSEKNRAIREQMTMPHTNGRKSNAQVCNEMTNDNGGVEPTRKELFEKIHLLKNGNYSSDSVTKVVAAMNALEIQHPELKGKGIAVNDTYVQVMGPERHGRVITLGLGVTPSIVFGSTNRQSQNERRKTEARL